MTIGTDGAGKSTIINAEAISLTTLRAILGEVPEERCRVWLHNADDDHQEIERRIAALRKLHAIPPKELEGWLFISGKDDFDFKVARGVGQQLIPDAATIADITDTIRANAIDIAAFDPLVAFHDANENSTHMNTVVRIFNGIAIACDCAIELSHHTRKPASGENGKEFTSDDGRGSGSTRAAVRGSRVLNCMSRQEASNAGIGEEERPFFIRLDKGKANYLPPAQKARWFKLRDVELLNGDHVGAVESYLYPGQDSPEKEAADRKAENVFLAVLRRFNAGDVPASPLRNSIYYAPKRFAEEKEARLAKLGHLQLEEAMKRLRDSGEIMPKVTGRGGRKTTLVPT
jgi:RecA-family ATPase